MATISFHKLHANGNDFIFIFSDNKEFLSKSFISGICNRKTGVGADGIFVISSDFVKHFDPDGSESFCVDGSLCLVNLYKNQIFLKNNFSLSNTEITINDNSISFSIDTFKHLEMEVEGIKGVYVEINNPHFFIETKEIDYVEVETTGKKLVNHKAFSHGANISFVKKTDNNLFYIITFERGVNSITNCCGSACCAYSLFIGKENKNLNFKFIPPSKMALQVSKNNNFLTVKGTVKYICKGTYFYD